MYSVASEKQSNSQTAHLNTSIINADSDGDEMHEDEWICQMRGGKICYFGALLQIAS